MSYSAYYPLPEGPPAEGDQLATNLGWVAWGNFVLDHHTQYPEAAHLAQEGWLDGAEELSGLEHELEQLLHEAGDPNLAGVTAQVLAALRARPEGALGLLVSDGEPGDGGEAAESVVREEHGPPPFPGAVFDATSHRWKLPHHDAKDESGAHPAETKAKSLAARIAKVPKALVARVGSWVQAKYQTLSARYGATGAKAVMAGMILLTPTPIPGSSLIPIALAEAVLRLKRAVAGGAAESVATELSAEAVERIARELLAELEADMKGEG